MCDTTSIDQAESGSSCLSPEEQEAAELEVDRAMEALLDAEMGSGEEDDDEVCINFVISIMKVFM